MAASGRRSPPPSSCTGRKSALRDLGKVFGLDPDECGRLAKVMQWWDGGEVMRERLREAGFDPDGPLLARLLPLAHELVAFPGSRGTCPSTSAAS